MTKERLLVVDDEKTLCDAIKFNLELEGYEVDTAYSAEDALKLNLKSYNLILLDVMMGRINGFELARKLKSHPDTASIPVIFCTAKDSEDDMVDGLGMGADDYITKPYTIRNLIARVKTVLRRSTSARPTTATLSYEGLVIDSRLKLCVVDGEEVTLPRKEFEILSMLMSNPGNIFSREEILKRVWPEEVIVFNRVVDVNITRLRAKIGRYGRQIITRSGYGYGFKG
jgi:two-component system phosphate regulon response regulator PhoB